MFFPTKGHDDGTWLWISILPGKICEVKVNYITCTWPRSCGAIWWSRHCIEIIRDICLYLPHYHPWWWYQLLRQQGISLLQYGLFQLQHAVESSDGEKEVHKWTPEFRAELIVLMFPYCKGFKAGNSSFKQHKLAKIPLRTSKACLVKYVFHIYHLSSSSVMFSEYQSVFKLIASLIPRCLCVGGEKRV